MKEGTSLESAAASSDFPVRVRFKAIADLDERTIEAWADLEQRALQPNAYLSPSFVLPAVRYLKPRIQPVVCLLEKEAPGVRELVGLGVFDAVLCSRRFPLPHLRAYRSQHSYLDGLLLDRAGAVPAAQGLFRWLQSRHSRWHGIAVDGQFRDEPADHLLTRAIEACGATWHEQHRTQRAVLIPAQAGEAYLREHLPSGRAKDLRRRWRRLEEHGPVRWCALSGPEITPACIDRFIDLEHRGWKGADGTSLRTRHEDEQFFREMIGGFAARDRAVFTELSVGDRVVASTSNLVSGKGGFAFKLGWHPDYQRMAPGLLNEVELIRNAPTLFEGLEFVDSGAAEGSFLEELWSGRRVVVSGAYAATPLARNLLQAMDRARQLKRWAYGFTSDAGNVPGRGKNRPRDSPKGIAFDRRHFFD